MKCRIFALTTTTVTATITTTTTTTTTTIYGFSLKNLITLSDFSSGQNSSMKFISIGFSFSSPFDL